MANEGMSIDAVKSICNTLEVSPSKHDSCGTYGGKPSTKPGKGRIPANTGAATSEFHSALHGKKKGM
jgi:hypothetical protein